MIWWITAIIQFADILPLHESHSRQSETQKENSPKKKIPKSTWYPLSHRVLPGLEDSEPYWVISLLPGFCQISSPVLLYMIFTISHFLSFIFISQQVVSPHHVLSRFVLFLIIFHPLPSHILSHLLSSSCHIYHYNVFVFLFIFWSLFLPLSNLFLTLSCLQCPMKTCHNLPYHFSFHLVSFFSVFISNSLIVLTISVSSDHFIMPSFLICAHPMLSFLIWSSSISSLSYWNSLFIWSCLFSLDLLSNHFILPVFLHLYLTSLSLIQFYQPISSHNFYKQCSRFSLPKHNFTFSFISPNTSCQLTFFTSYLFSCLI